MSYDEQGDRLDLAGDWSGIVTTNEDPLGLGRIRARVPGLLEPQSPWLDPKLPGLGSGVGLWIVPPRGARVVVTLNAGGRSTERGFYTPAGLRNSDELPTEVSDGSVNVTALFSDRYALILDNRPETLGASLIDRERGDQLRLNGLNLSIQIGSTVATEITSTGEISISAPLVTIQGRPVLPSETDPI